MSDIVLSKGIRGNLLALQSTADLRDRTQTRLATGKKVNTALDNPTNYFNAASLNSRAGDISNLLDAIGNAVKTMEAASTGITAITKVLETAQATARQAIQSASTTARVNGTLGTVAGAPTALTESTSLTSLGYAASDTITVTTGTNRTTTLTVAAGSTVGDLIKAINSNTANTGAAVTTGITGTPAVGSVAGADARASLSADGRILIEAIGTQPLTISSSVATPLSNLGFSSTNSTAAAGTVNNTRQTLAAQFSELRRQIDQLSKDAGFNGVNLLNGDTLQVLFNERQTSSITISGARFQVGNDLKVSDQQNNFQTDKDINDALSQLQTALGTSRAQASTFGSNLSVVQIRQNFTSSLINTLKTGADNLTLADMNEESANMLSLQTRQQLSSQALSLANQADQGVLRLFG
ncbi:MAG: flagellin [Alphaproteobacteria bacterium]